MQVILIVLFTWIIATYDGNVLKCNLVRHWLIWVWCFMYQVTMRFYFWKNSSEISHESPRYDLVGISVQPSLELIWAVVLTSLRIWGIRKAVDTTKVLFPLWCSVLGRWADTFTLNVSERSTLHLLCSSLFKLYISFSIIRWTWLSNVNLKCESLN